MCFDFLCGLIIFLFLFSIYTLGSTASSEKFQLSFTIRDGHLESRGTLAPSLILILKLVKVERPQAEGVLKKRGLMTHIIEISGESRGGIPSSYEIV